MHRLVRIIRGRVPDNRDVVAKFRGEADRGFDASVCDEPDSDQPLNAVPPQLIVQVSVGETARTPVLERCDIARLRREFAANLAAPRAVLKCLAQPRAFLNGSDVLPGLVIAGTVR